LARANLTEAENREKRIAQLIKEKDSKPTTSGMLELGMHYYTNHKYSAAVAAFKAGLKTDSKNVMLLNNTCASLCEEKKWAEAKTYCEKALAVDPNNSLAQANLNWASNNISAGNS
jgi:Tfp pilus assembly protein PilF